MAKLSTDICRICGDGKSCQVIFAANIVVQPLISSSATAGSDLRKLSGHNNLWQFFICCNSVLCALLKRLIQEVGPSFGIGFWKFRMKFA